jgi:hypothetical protein
MTKKELLAQEWHQGWIEWAARAADWPATWYVVGSNGRGGQPPPGWGDLMVWTVSPNPRVPGWAVKANGAGLPKVVAEQIVARLNAAGKG